MEFNNLRIEQSSTKFDQMIQLLWRQLDNLSNHLRHSLDQNILKPMYLFFEERY